MAPICETMQGDPSQGDRYFMRNVLEKNEELTLVLY